MKKIFTILLGVTMAMSASAITLDDLTGKYELQDPYGSLTYIDRMGTTTFGIKDGDIEKYQNLINNIKVTTDGEYLYFSDFLNFSFQAVADLEAMTVTIPVQTITPPTGYPYTQCLYESSMYPDKDKGETQASFNEEEAKDIVLTITEDGDLTLYDAESATWDYIAYWGYGYIYGYIKGVFHKTADFVADDSLKDILGKQTCNDFRGEWCSIWGEWSEDWYTFNIKTGEGIETIGVDPGPFEVTINSLGGLDVQFCGLWWGALIVNGSYDPETKTFVFPLQTVWGGYTFCNSSICEIEVPTSADVVPATAVVNDDSTITMNYTVEYDAYPFLYALQTIGTPQAGIGSAIAETAPAEYYTISGIRVNYPTAAGIYIVRQGSTVTKQAIR